MTSMQEQQKPKGKTGKWKKLSKKLFHHKSKSNISSNDTKQINSKVHIYGNNDSFNNKNHKQASQYYSCMIPRSMKREIIDFNILSETRKVNCITNHYQFIKTLGQGAISTVYHAKNIANGKSYALKCVKVCIFLRNLFCFVGFLLFFYFV